MDQSKWGVHTEHCCVLHGCKYGDEDCPVEGQEVEQRYACEECGEEGLETLEDVRSSLEYRENHKEIDINVCPYCTDSSNKKLINTNGFSDDLWCSVCKEDYTVVYKRVPVKIILDEK